MPEASLGHLDITVTSIIRNGHRYYHHIRRLETSFLLLSMLTLLMQPFLQSHLRHASKEHYTVAANNSVFDHIASST